MRSASSRSVRHSYRVTVALLDLGFDPLERGPHSVPIGVAARPAEQRPVQTDPDVVGELERLGDVGAVAGGLEVVAPGVEGVGAVSYSKGELAAPLAHQHGASRPVDRAPTVAPHMT